MKYDPKWNKNGASKILVLQSKRGSVIQRHFIDEPGFDRELKFLTEQKNRWQASDQFVHGKLEIKVL